MRYLIDTNVLSEIRKGRTAAAGVVAFFSAHPGDDFALSVITILEIEIGIRAKARSDEGQARSIGLWLHGNVIPTFGARILPVTMPVALKCAELHVPDRKPERDALIAATAIVHGLTVVTRNVKDFAPTGVPTFNPWDQA